MQGYLPYNQNQPAPLTAPPAPPPRRDILRLIVYYLFLATMTVLGIGYGYYFSEQFFASDKPEIVETIMNLFKLFWLVPLPYALLNFYSFVRYPVIQKPVIARPDSQGDFHGRVYFRYVTRGLNPNLIANNVDLACRLLDDALPTDRWRVEVVTDNPLQLDERDGLVAVITVPPDYEPPNGTRFKARSLNYVLGCRRPRPRIGSCI
jgi:hypothetical protein